MSQRTINHPILLLIILSALLSQCAKTNLSSPPNIIVIFVDDMGYGDIGCFGADDISTPHLEQLAREGVKLTNFYAAQAVCSASRAALLTGCYPNRIGIHNALTPNASHGLHPEETTLAELLKSVGYNTAIFGKWHLGHLAPFLPTRHGFDEFYGIPYSNDMWPYHPERNDSTGFQVYPPLPLYENETVIDTLDDQTFLTQKITEKSLDFIERNKDQPFFLYVPHPQPHVPLFVSPSFSGKSNRGLYGDVVMELDGSVGQITAKLKTLGIEENTLIIFTSDNGPWLSYGNHAGQAGPLREGKGTAWEGGQREPFIIKYPSDLKPGQEVNTPIMAIDILPTLASLAGATIPNLPIDGKNVWPVIAGATTQSPHDAYFYYYKTNELHAVRSGPWKMYYPHIYRTLNGREGGKDGLPVKYDQVSLGNIALYNLDQDIGETTNVASDHPEIVNRLSQYGDAIRLKLGDNLTDQKGSETRAPGRIEN